jgi:hypothetical protein
MKLKTIVSDTKMASLNSIVPKYEYVEITSAEKAQFYKYK